MASRQEVEHFLDSTFHRQEDGWIATITLRKGKTVDVRVIFVPGNTPEEAGLVITAPLVSADAYSGEAVLSATASFPFGVKRYGSELVLYHFVYTATVDENEILVPARVMAHSVEMFTMS
jgi:hypothetical protein